MCRSAHRLRARARVADNHGAVPRLDLWTGRAPVNKDYFYDTCACGNRKQKRSAKCFGCVWEKHPLATPTTPHIATVQTDRDKQRYAAEIASLKLRYNESLKTIAQQEGELRTVAALHDGIDNFCITATPGSGKAEATPVLVASDWHVEENVGAEVGGLNRYNLDIAKERATRFFTAGLRLVKLLNQDVTIHTVVLALLGDFISNDIHEGEQVELNEQQPMHALVTAQNFIISGLEFLLANSPYTFVLPCHSGNHARTTRKTRFSAENGHSVEYLMYLHLAAYFKNEPRIEFIIPEGMHSYLNIYDWTIRFHHGHAVKYGGGVGGIFIPTYKAISQWNKARHADLDVFGHFHQMKDGGNFLCNGSLIGYNGFALSIKADFEKPRQLLFMMDSKRGRTCTWPIIV